MKVTKLSIVCPVYNEESNIDYFYTSVKSYLSQLNIDYQILFSDNASTDSTLECIKSIAKIDNNISYVSYIKNYGYERSIYTALCSVTGSHAAVLDVDLEDPIELLGSFIELANTGYQFVYGIRESRQESIFLTTMRRFFYRLVSVMLSNKNAANVGNFFLVDLSVINIIRQINDPDPYLRGLLFSLNLHSVGVPYGRNSRIYGSSKFGFLKLVDFAMLSIANLVGRPVLWSLRLSFFSVSVLFCFIAYYIGSRILYSEQWPPGIATLIILNLFMISMFAAFVGVFGFYIVKIYKQLEVKNITIIADTNIKN